MSNKLRYWIIVSLVDEGHTWNEITKIYQWDNSVFWWTSDDTKSSVNWIISLTKQECITNIQNVLQVDFWIESQYELNYLNPGKFIEKYKKNELISRSFEFLTWKKLTLEWLVPFDFKHKQLNKAIRNLKGMLDLPEKDNNYFKNNISNKLASININCRHSYEMKWSRAVDKYFLWNFEQRIACKKIFWKPRLKDVPYTTIFETLWLQYLTQNEYRIKVKQELTNYFGSYKDYSNDKTKTHEDNLRDLNKTWVYVKYFFHHILKNTTWNLTKYDFEKLFVWSDYKTYTNESVKNTDSIKYLKNSLSIIWVNDLYSWAKYPLWKIKELLSNSDFTKHHVKKLINKPIHLFVYDDYLTLLEQLFPEWIDDKNIKEVTLNRISSLWFNDTESIKNNFRSERQRRKFFYQKWNEVFSYIFQRKINIHPELARLNRWWDMSQITHEDVDSFIYYLK